MKKVAAADVVIFGGGIAGLWLLNRLRQSGFSAILFESGSLGGGQTHKAQGIIHGGMKYALQGVLSADSKAMSEMPERWRQCLQGKGEIDLSAVPVLSSQHYLWAPTKFGSKLAGFFAGAALTSKVESLSKEHYPAVFQHPDFKGEVFSLDEIVIDVPILIRELVKANQDAVFKIEPLCDEELKFDDHGKLVSATVYMAGKAVEVSAQQFVFTAGAGNEVIIRKLKQPDVAMQRRPLHMVMVKTPFNYPLYAHCLGLGARPRITVTTHHTQNGSTVWYLGGQLAEDGIHKDSATQIQAAREELQTLFPWLDFATAEFASFMIDRAEPKQKGGMKPETSFIKVIENIIVAWPTKLALAPKLAEEILQQLQAAHLTQHLFDIRELRSWPMPPLAMPVWEDAFCKSAG
ncbi:MAG: FAD-dependent oxidoreductase [Gammaproteobacteria bacterium]|nr:MAG: FAD-dependent oxidoreductase [Gammaproteobacteria bacterium]